MGFKKKEELINSFVLSNFNYCPFVSHFCSSKSSRKNDKIQERALRIPVNTLQYSTSHYNQLLNKSSKASLEVKRLRNLALEILKTLNYMNPEYTKKKCYKTTNLIRKPFNIKVN